MCPKPSQSKACQGSCQFSMRAVCPQAADALQKWRKAKTRKRTGSGADVERPSKKTCLAVWNGTTHAAVHSDTPPQETRGRKPLNSEKLWNKLPRLLDGLESKNKKSTNYAPQIREEVCKRADLLGEPRPSIALVKKKLNAAGMTWHRTRKKLMIDAENAAARLQVALEWDQKSEKFFQTQCLFIDEGTFKWHTSPKARRAGRRRKKVGCYHNGKSKMSLHKARVTQCKRKHTPGTKSGSVFCAVGNGKVPPPACRPRHEFGARSSLLLCSYSQIREATGVAYSKVLGVLRGGVGLFKER